MLSLARRLGISTQLTRRKPLALGASCVIPGQLAAAYAALGRAGQPIDLSVTISVYDNRVGYTLDRRRTADAFLTAADRLDLAARQPPEPARNVVEPAVAYLATQLLIAVVARGTGRLARKLERPAAGKTGTTNKNSDAWFVGFTRDHVAVVWLGHDDPARHLGPRDDGSHAALPLWVEIMARASGERRARPLFDGVPDGLIQVSIDPETGFRTRRGGRLLWFLAGTEPSEESVPEPSVPTSLGRGTRGF